MLFSHQIVVSFLVVGFLSSMSFFDGTSLTTNALSVDPKPLQPASRMLAHDKIQSSASPNPHHDPTDMLSRRNWFSVSTKKVAAATATTFGVVLTSTSVPSPAAAAAAASSTTTTTTTTSVLVDELQSSKEKLSVIPQLLQDQEWDKVRTVLKTPPVNKLWNLGDSQNTVLRLAKETGDVDLFELKDDLAYNLQMCDQLT